MSAYDDWLAEQAAQREAQGLTRSLRDSDRGEPLLDLAGNDYLGLARDPRVVAAAMKAAETSGAGAGASRLVSGTLSLHTELEDDLAEFTGFPTALVTSTGYHANLSVVTALADADTLIVSDAHIHASLVDACRLSRGQVQVVPHHDVAAVEQALAHRTQPRALVLAESIYSVLGDAAPLAELSEVVRRHDALLVVDEAHGLGVVGPGGRGLLAETGLAGAAHVVATGTLSKSLGAQGGFVLASAAVRNHLVNRARPFIYDTGLAPAAAGAASAALGVLRGDPTLPDQVRHVAAVLADACGVTPPSGAVLSVAMRGPREAVAAVSAAADRGVRIGCFRPPSTPDGISRLRLTAHAGISESDLDHAVTVLRSSGPMRITLVTGTDTGVGKTVATAALACKLTAEGKRVVVVKPAQTGVEDDEPGDAQEVTRLSGVHAVEGIRLRHPLAPETAARLEGVTLPDLETQRDLILCQDADHVLVEGAGGILVNLGHDWNLLDLGEALVASKADLDVVVVCRAGLGTLNHSTLTARAIRDGGLKVAGLVIGAWPAETNVAEQQNLVDLPAVTELPVLGQLPEGAAADWSIFREVASEWLVLTDA